MTLIVRDFRASDAAAVAEARRAAWPYRVTTAEGVAWEVRNAPAEQRFRLLVAESDGLVVGSAPTGVLTGEDTERHRPGRAFTDVHVHPAHRRRGVGTALLHSAEEYLAGLGAGTVYSWTLDERPSTTFAERRGYRRGRGSRCLRLDLTTAGLPPLGPLPPGVEVRRGTDFAADPRPCYVAESAAGRDEPGDISPDPGSYEQWLAAEWRRPERSAELTSYVLVDGVVTAYSIGLTDGRGRYVSGGTGTLRGCRGRGLAKLAKNHSLHLAHAAGCTEAIAGNDTGNAPMLTINQWFGYRPAAEEWRYLRELAV
ncbi:GNAT family N-acetyltransferase [Streptomyces palmae]|uniref:N-acetyltransferase n=1 Tax=Streptomyces palmae TaxID=1701085 RepID=A0A4Z0GG37_9ACTN|nr:GNAT family N-acetyltransferase [Streptomyces palmae]TGA95401.1 N-acetyltransferase [Streptomyces palmae]